MTAVVGGDGSRLRLAQGPKASWQLSVPGPAIVQSGRQYAFIRFPSTQWECATQVPQRDGSPRK
jgi:hypothetical protein